MEVFIQQLINGITLGSIYGLIAIGYTMSAPAGCAGGDAMAHSARAAQNRDDFSPIYR